MKLIPWKFNNNDVEGYTVASYDHGILYNMYPYDKDQEDIVLHNRQELAKCLDTDLDHMVATHQTHSDHFIQVSLKDGGKGIYSKETAFEDYDAMYTRDRDLLLYIFHADCCPVFLYDSKQELIASIHSGWKGTVTELVTKVARHLIENEGCHPEDMYAYVGPTIEKDQFEAMDDIIDLVKKMSFDTSSYYTKTDDIHYHLDHKGLIKAQLLNIGIPENQIDVSPYCTTKNNDLFFSYRKTKTDNRNISIIRLKKS